MADLPFDLDAGLTEQLVRVLDVEGKIPRALEALGPVGGRDVVLIDAPDGIRTRQLSELGARVALVGSSGPASFDAPDASADALVACWSPAFRDAAADAVSQAERILRPGGRLIVMDDYGRDDMATLRGDPQAPHAWSRRDGPFLANGFRIRVIHCYLTFGSMDETAAFLGAAFDEAGRTMATTLRRPRLSYNVALYHRGVGTNPEEVVA